MKKYLKRFIINTPIFGIIIPIFGYFYTSRGRLDTYVVEPVFGLGFLGIILLNLWNYYINKSSQNIYTILTYQLFAIISVITLSWGFDSLFRIGGSLDGGLGFIPFMYMYIFACIIISMFLISLNIVTLISMRKITQIE